MFASYGCDVGATSRAAPSLFCDSPASPALDLDGIWHPHLHYCAVSFLKPGCMGMHGWYASVGQLLGSVLHAKAQTQLHFLEAEYALYSSGARQQPHEACCLNQASVLCSPCQSLIAAHSSFHGVILPSSETDGRGFDLVLMLLLGEQFHSEAACYNSVHTADTACASVTICPPA